MGGDIDCFVAGVGSGETLQGVGKFLSEHKTDAKIIAVCRSVREDVDKAESCGVWGVSCSLPIGELQIKHKLKWPEEKVIDVAVQITSYARQKGLYVEFLEFSEIVH